MSSFRTACFAILISPLVAGCNSLDGKAAMVDDVVAENIEIYPMRSIEGELIEVAFAHMQTLDDPDFQAGPSIRCYSIAGSEYVGNSLADLSIRFFSAQTWSLSWPPECRNIFDFRIDFLDRKIVGCVKFKGRFPYRCGPGEPVSLGDREAPVQN